MKKEKQIKRISTRLNVGLHKKFATKCFNLEVSQNTKITELITNFLKTKFKIKD